MWVSEPVPNYICVVIIYLSPENWIYISHRFKERLRACVKSHHSRKEKYADECPIMVECVSMWK